MAPVLGLGRQDSRDHAGSPPDTPRSGSDHGVHADALVFCCRDDNFKVTASVFSSWMQTLSLRQDRLFRAYRWQGGGEDGVLNQRLPHLRSLAASVAFCAWYALLCYPWMTVHQDLTDPELAFIAPVGSPTVLMCQAAGVILFTTTMCVSHLGYFGSNIGRLNFPQLGILLIVYLSFALQLHDQETSILAGIFYTALIPVAALALSVFWTIPPNHLERCLGVASVILCLFGICAIAILGWPQQRNVGGIQPNLFAACQLVAFILSLFRPGIVSMIVRVLCIAMILLVSSRYALIGCMIVTALFELTFDPLSPTKIPVAVVAVVAAIILWPEIRNIMALDDSDRGLSSGFTGRDILWYKAIAAISTHPLGIGFKRAAVDEAGHNGYLRTILEFGAAGGGLIILFVACSIVLAGVEAIALSGKKSRQHRFASARFGGLVALAFGAFFQPQLFSFGDVFGISALFLLFRPKSIARFPHRQQSLTIGTARTMMQDKIRLGHRDLACNSFE